MKKIYVVFDQDGVIFDSEPVNYRALKEYLGNKDVDYTLDVHERYFGYNQKSFFTAMKDLHSLDESVDQLMADAEPFYFKYHPEVTFMPNVKNLIHTLHSNDIKIALATSSSRPPTQQNLKKHGIADFFHFTICGDEVTAGKPDPEIYIKAKEKLHQTDFKGFAIEDSPAGIKAAKGSGLSVIGYQTKHNQNADLSNADFLFNDHQLILDFLLQH